ncbi:MAG TPA: hypothetical protein VHC48_16895, partial [Puia sp.]|nr:hypothetical protein [Puia sp.]
VDYFTAPFTQDEFNSVKQAINLDALRLLETLKIDVAGASTDIRVSGLNTVPVNPGTGEG